jgi:UDP-N-acetylglucosamine 4,6-dehydratase (inverting)
MNKKYFKDKTILITGGTGSFGQAFVNYILKNNFHLRKIIIFSRDELKQFEMQKKIEKKYLKYLRFFIGDVRDKDRLKLAFQDVDLVVHAAALKQVPAAEYNPFEFVQTNVMGAQNIIEACLDYSSKIQNIIALSTDKASSPINLYGATKLCSDKIFVSANNIKGNKKVKFSVVRYGNVMGSRGSVLHSFLEQAKKGTIEITHKDMTRFNIILEEAIKIILWSFNNNYGGEIFVPKLHSFKILDLARAVCKNCNIKYTGIRPGEKLHEEMISSYDARNTVDAKAFYIILHKNLFKNYRNKKLVSSNFYYRSDTNKNFLDIQSLKRIISNI